MDQDTLKKLLSELSPLLRNGVVPGTFLVTFDCPGCGPPFRVAVTVGSLGLPWTFDERGWASASIRGRLVFDRHGTRVRCGWRGTLQDGVVEGDAAPNAPQLAGDEKNPGWRIEARAGVSRER